MKNKIFIIACLFTFCFSSYSQEDKIIVSAYIKRAVEAIETSVDYESALISFNKALERLDTITDRKIAILGSKIYYENHHKQETLQDQLNYLIKSKEFCDQYFSIFKNNATEEYMNNTEHALLVIESIEELKEEISIEEEEKRKKELELRKIDSLRTSWFEKSESLSIKVDSLYLFNKNNIAIYKNNNSFGLINDNGEVVLEAKEFKDVVHFDGYFIFKNNVDQPSKLYSYNSNNNSGFLLPGISEFNTLSTSYGKVMLPRGNGRLVTYPNNSKEPFVYDLNLKKTIKVANQEDLLKSLKKTDIIDKYNKDGEVKINKEWYVFGGHLGGGIHPLYSVEDYTLNSFLCSIDGKLLNTTLDYQYLGYFYQSKYQAVKGNKTTWVNQNGTKVSDAKDEAEKYNGNSVVKKLESGAYQIFKDGMIILGKEKLPKLPEFLRQFSGKE